MTLWAIVLFAFAATAGIFMATRILTGRGVPLMAAFIHGALGASGLALLTFMLLTTESFGTTGVAFTVLACNALLGFFLFSRHLFKKPWPVVLVVTHGLAAAIGVSILVVAFFAAH